jgi:phosphoribosylglycinamide formyltransferase 1
MPRRLVILVSGEGTLLQHLVDACAAGTVAADIVAVGTDRDGTVAAKRAEAAGIPVFICRVADYPDRAAWDDSLTRVCASFRPDLVISAGFLKLFGPAFLAEFSGRCINSHPALLPSFPGLHAVRDALAHGVKVTGCTLFFVDEGVDSGPVIAQEAVAVRPDDDEGSLTERIKQRERALLVSCVAAMLSGGWSVSGRRVLIAGHTGEPGEAAEAHA